MDKADQLSPTQSFLVQENEHRERWKIINVWNDMQTLDAVRKSGTTPKGKVLFNDVGVEPTLSVLEVKEEF